MKNLASVFVVVVSLLPNSSAEAESEDNGEELSGGHSNYSADRQVEVAADVVLQLVVAARVQEWVCLLGTFHTLRKLRGDEQGIGVLFQDTARFWYNHSSAFSGNLVYERPGLLKIFVAFNSAAAHLGHNMIPAQSHCIPLALSCVIFFQGVLQESFGVMVSLRLVQSAQQDGSDLQKEDDDEEDAIGSEEDPGLFESATVAKDGDDEDESADGNEDISGLLYHCWLDKVF